MVGKTPPSGKSIRVLGNNRSSSGIASRSAAGSNACNSVPGEDGIALGDVPSPPPRPTNSLRGTDGKSVPSNRSEHVPSEVGGPSRRKTDVSRAGEIVGGGTGAAGTTVSDWSLQSCDDADDGAVKSPLFQYLHESNVVKTELIVIARVSTHAMTTSQLTWR